MNKEYTVKELLQKLKDYFENQGYLVEVNFENFLPARVPLYCKKDNEEIVIDFTIDKYISKNIFFPSETIGGVKIDEASPVRFYQYYFANAKIFFAYPYYVSEDNGFIEFRNVCERRGIGLLKIFDTKIEEVVKSRILFDEICAELEIHGNKKIKNKLEYHLGNCLHYFVYYPHSIFKRRAITGKFKERMSYILIDKLTNLKNISYKKELIDLSNDYRKEYHDDYEIAEDCINNLWDKYLGLRYPNIHIKMENILQRDEIYREHFVHMFQVFLMGAYILDNIYPTISAKSKEIENVWLAASTFHDFNYGLQNFDIWLLQFFEDTLRVRNKQTKENLNLLNLDSTMIREELFDKIVKMTSQLKSDWVKNDKEKMIRFFYEKVVRDRNHGVLSAISLLKLFDESNENKRKINMKGILKAAIAIGCHDEDVWGPLCGCQGYRRSSGMLPSNEDECINKCNRESLLWPTKKSRIYKEKMDNNSNKDIAIKSNCENWEREIMCRRVIDKIKFEDYPILFLLIFCDNIQDEGRITNSDNTSQLDLSKLIDVFITTEAEKILIGVKLESNNDEKKKEEIERVAWCLKNDRFRISINDTLKKMDGNGGG